MKNQVLKFSAKDSKVICGENASNEKVVEIDDSLVYTFPNVELEVENKGHDEEDTQRKSAKLEPLKVNPLFEDFSYLDDDSTSIFELLDMARARATGTFKLSKWTLQ